MTFKEEALDLIVKGKVESALEVISNYLQDSKKTDLWNEVTMLKTSYAENQKQKRLGIVSMSESAKAQNRLTFSILNLIDTIIEEKNNGNGNDNGKEKINIFISYAHKDIPLKDELEKHLNALKRNGKIDIWSDAQVDAGESWEKVINKQLENADIILLLVSADFLASDFLWDELQSVIERHKAGSAVAIPIILRPCLWNDTPIKVMQVLPKNGKPISLNDNRDTVYAQILNGIKRIIGQREEYKTEIKAKIIEHEEQIKNGLSYKNINNLEALVELYKKINNRKKVKKHQEDLAQLKFEYNISNPIKIQEFHIEKVSVYKDIHWELQPKINVLLGRNGFGKSHLMRLIPCMLRNEKDIMDWDYHLMTFSDLRVIVEQNGESKDTHYNNCEFMEDIGNIPMLAIPAVRNFHPSKSITPASDDIDGELKHIGASHLINQNPFDKLIQNQLYIFANNLVKESLRSKKPDIQKTIQKSFSVQLVTDIVRQLTGDSSFTIKNVKEYYGQAQLDIEVLTEGNEEPILLQKVSQGTVSVLSIVLLIYHYLKSLYSELVDEKLVRQKAIVFIDEIDAHMHPIWQRKIVNILRNSFPNIQFILTAHSPLIVAGCLEKEVVVLRKEGKLGKFSLHQFEQNFIGKEIEDIYRIVFEIEDVDEDDTYKSLLSKRSRWSSEQIDEQINELDEKENLTDEEENKLNELFLLSRIKYIREEKESRDLGEEVEQLRAENRQLKYKLETLKN